MPELPNPTADEYLLAVYEIACRRGDLDISQIPVSHEAVDQLLDIHDSFMTAANGRLETDGLAHSSDASITLTPTGRDRAEFVLSQRNKTTRRRAWEILNLPFPAQLTAGLILLLLGGAIGFLLPRASETPPPVRIPHAVNLIEPAREVTARVFAVESIVDGDTIRIMYDGESTKLRIANIDTPERAHPDYDKATQALRELIEGREITIDFTDPKGKRDNWGRLLASVFVDGRDVGETMVEAGWAEPWPNK